MNCLVVYFNNVTKNIYNELVYGNSIEMVIYNFNHGVNRNVGDNIINIIKMG